MKHPSASSQWKVPLWVPTLLPISWTPPDALNVRLKLSGTNVSRRATPLQRDSEPVTGHSSKKRRCGVQMSVLFVMWEKTRLRSISLELLRHSKPCAVTPQLNVWRLDKTMEKDASDSQNNAPRDQASCAVTPVHSRRQFWFTTMHLFYWYFNAWWTFPSIIILNSILF